MDSLTLTKWARFGHDRLYVAAPDGTRLGYWDLTANTPCPETPDLLPVLEQALAAYRTLPSPTPATVVVPLTLLVPAEHDVDLADNRPGAAAREQAIAEREAAPVRTFLARVLGVHTDERAWRIGADGEEMVAAQLRKLGAAWRVLHAVPVGERGSDIDHVVIGPGGVYTINAKHHPDARVWAGGDTIRVDGRRVPYVRNSRFEATRASRLLTEAVGYPVLVTGLVAFVGVRGGFTVRDQPADGLVHVIARKELADLLKRRGAQAHLASEQVKDIYAAARHASTWGQAH